MRACTDAACSQKSAARRSSVVLRIVLLRAYWLKSGLLRMCWPQSVRCKGWHDNRISLIARQCSPQL